MNQPGAAQDLGPYLSVVPARIERGRGVPLVGVVAGGQPFQTYEVLETLEVPSGTWQERSVLALRVRGSSMVEDGILDGDYLLVDPNTAVCDGQTVVAEIDGEATVKRLYREPGGAIRLQPANRSMLPLVVRAEHVTIRGVVVGILRKQGFARRPPRAPLSLRRGTTATDRRTLDLALRIVDHNIAEWDRVTTAYAGQCRDRRCAEAAALGQSLRALRSTYSATEHPRLRQALIEEAGKISRQMRAISRSMRWDANLRPLNF